jgi:hypothetical protein
MRIQIWPCLFQRWVIVDAEGARLAWAGNRWVPLKPGAASYDSAITNFASYSAAVEFVSASDTLAANELQARTCLANPPTHNPPSVAAAAGPLPRAVCDAAQTATSSTAAAEYAAPSTPPGAASTPSATHNPAETTTRGTLAKRSL